MRINQIYKIKCVTQIFNIIAVFIELNDFKLFVASKIQCVLTYIKVHEVTTQYSFILIIKIILVICWKTTIHNSKKTT